MVLGITGSGLQPTSEMGHLGNIPQESLEDHEGLDDHIHPNQWSKYHHSTNTTGSQHKPYGHHGCYLVEKVVSNILKKAYG